MTELENLDDMSFSELMKKSVSEIPDFCSEWTDFNEHDPGITFLEMLMWLTEMQRYYLSQITDEHLESYLRLIGTRSIAAEPTVILARFFSEKNAFIKKGTLFYIGEIPYQLVRDTVIVPNKPGVFLCENDGILIRQNLSPFKGGILPLYFSMNKLEQKPMKEGFYPQARIKARLITGDNNIECLVEDYTYGLYQSGFINISLPEDLDDNASELRLDLISDDNLKLPSADCFSFDIFELIQRDGNGNTLGADGRVKESVIFSSNIDGVKINASVFREVESGKDTEMPQDAFTRFKSEQTRLPRAVTADDYTRLVRETPGLRAEIISVFSKEIGKVSVCIKTADNCLRENEIKNLRKVLFTAKPIGTEIEILSPIIFSAKLFISVKTNGWAGERKLTEHIREVFKLFENQMGVKIIMPGLYRKIKDFPIVSEIKSMHLSLGQGRELFENDTLTLPEDGLLSLCEIIIQ